MGGRGAYSASASRGVSSTGSIAGQSEDYSRGAQIAAELGVSEKRGAEIYDAINDWADGSTGIKNAQRGGSHSEQDAKDAAALDEFIQKSHSHQGILVRIMNVQGFKKPRKGGKIVDDGSITSWTTPGNYWNALNGFGNGSGTPVVYHVSATKGADTRRWSGLAGLDGEILQASGYESSLTISKVQTKTEKTMEYREGRKVVHVYLSE